MRAELKVKLYRGDLPAESAPHVTTPQRRMSGATTGYLPGEPCVAKVICATCAAFAASITLTTA